MKIWLDDQYEERKNWFSEEWIHTRWPADTIQLLSTGQVTHLSLDHDLGDDVDAKNENRKERTGNDVLNWIEAEVFHGRLVPPEITIHSKNSVGQEKMKRAIKQIQLYAEKFK